MSDPRRELADLVEAVKNEVERRGLRGARAMDAPLLKAALERPAPAAPAAPTPPSAAARSAAPPAARQGTAGSAGTRVAAPPAARPAPPAPKRPVLASPPRPPARPDAPEATAVPAADRGKKLPLVPLEPEPPDYRERMEALAALGREAAGCRRCGLCRTRTQVVFGTGRARTRILFIGEAPGGDEDRLGQPFVGRAGKLLDQIIDAAGFQRDEVYIANILKCRPPENRNPLPPEIDACTPYLERQIQLVAPKIICALGKFAAQYLTGDMKAPIGALRGRIHYYRDSIMVLPTYHPAALLRTPSLKRIVWEDFQVLRAEYLR